MPRKTKSVSRVVVRSVPSAEPGGAAQAVLVLPAELTHGQASACLRMLLQGLKVHRERAVVVDAHALAVFDTSALAVLLECRREALAEGKSFVVQGLPQALTGMAGLYGVDVLLAPTAVAVEAPERAAGTG
jgi:phospholipid transport system transporter-binding protein